VRKAILASALLSAVGISFATNGDNLIGVSPASRGMGGIGVGRGCSKNPLLGPSPQPQRELTLSSPYPTPLPPTQASEEKGPSARPFQG